MWCKEKGLVTVTNLEVDHTKILEECTYEEAIDLSLLRVLCRSCHNLRHNRFEGKVKKKKKWQDERW
ncbi:HNH endonuclease [Solibacillus sp. FSL W8-0474]|uniref:HNH endonuclease n=1 Tax=Solibacillus sp. FSL W8-0474 TaxID=2975336 RepID=UPI0030F4D5C8